MKYSIKRITSLISLLLVVMGLFPAPREQDYVYTGADIECEKVSFIPVGESEESKISSRFFELISGKEKADTDMLIVGGTVFGAHVKTSFVTVGECKDQKELKVGDIIIKLSDKEVRSVGDAEKIISDSNGETIKAVIKRDGKTHTVTLLPKLSSGEYKLGVRLKDTAAGIGTVTYIDPKTGNFGGLGHGICDPDTGEVIPITSGDVRGVILGGVEKGESGKPGELSGILTDKTVGQVARNTDSGLFGRLDSYPTDNNMLLPIGHRNEVKTGKAVIYSTVKNGRKTKFDIEITEVDTSSHGTKSFKIKVTDPALLAITGGIVRGMSGSPIIQNGKLIGAVTHVMVANPTEGYGIFIENMLNAAENTVPKAA